MIFKRKSGKTIYNYDEDIKNILLKRRLEQHRSEWKNKKEVKNDTVASVYKSR